MGEIWRIEWRRTIRSVEQAIEVCVHPLCYIHGKSLLLSNFRCHYIVLTRWWPIPISIATSLNQSIKSRPCYLTPSRAPLWSNNIGFMIYGSGTYEAHDLKRTEPRRLLIGPSIPKHQDMKSTRTEPIAQLQFNFKNRCSRYLPTLVRS